MTHKDAIQELAGMVKVLALHILIFMPADHPSDKDAVREITTRADEIVAALNGRTLEQAA